MHKGARWTEPAARTEHERCTSDGTEREVTGVVVSREWTPESRAFVFSTFAASYRKPSGLADAGSSFKANVLDPFTRAVASGDATLTLLHLEDAPDDYVGWALTAGNVLLYVYVKQAYRRRGYGREMLPDGLAVVVYQTPAGVALQRARYGKPLRPAPYLLMEAA